MRAFCDGVEEAFAVLREVFEAAVEQVPAAARAAPRRRASCARAGRRGRRAPDRPARATGRRSARGPPSPPPGRPCRGRRAPRRWRTKAVDVEAAELGPALGRQPPRCGCRIQSHELADLDVAPHPGRKARKGLVASRLGRAMAHVVVDAGGVGPVGLDRDDGEAVPLDQPPGDRRARAVELRGAVRRLAEQHHLGVGVAVEQRREGVVRRRWRAGARRGRGQGGRRHRRRLHACARPEGGRS